MKSGAVQNDEFDLVSASSPVLIVDDHPPMLSILRQQLAGMGFTRIVEASDPAAAVKLLRTQRVGLIISDIEMQPINGLRFLEFVRQSPSISKTPFILITGSLQFQHVADAKSLSADAYVLKPFDAPALRRSIWNVLTVSVARSPVVEGTEEPVSSDPLSAEKPSRTQRFRAR